MSGSSCEPRGNELSSVWGAILSLKSLNQGALISV